MSGSVLHLDFETRSAVDLKKVGAHAYAEHPSTSVICLSYRVGDGPVQRWRPGNPSVAHMADAYLILAAHNAGFERAIWERCLKWGPLPPALQDCTMARAAALGLPLGLDALGEVLKTAAQKDKDGYALMMRMCRPKTRDPLTWVEDAASIERLQAYCDQDVRTESDIAKKLPPLSPSERRVWLLDQTINDRGFMVDLEMCRRAAAAADVAKKQADREMWRLTNGAVKKCTETAKIVAWINAQGVPCTSIAKGEIEEIVTASQVLGSEAVEKAILLRRAAARTSTAKFQAMVDAACADGRVRGSLQYHGAATGRWAGRGVQPQNFPRVDEDRDLPGVEAALWALERFEEPTDVVDTLALQGFAPLESLSKSIRPMIVAPEGRKLVGGDLANIEGRVNAWLAGEDWKLQAFRDYDAGTGPDLYKVTAARLLGKAEADVSRFERQTSGKVPELSMGYQGSVGAVVRMAAQNGLKVGDLIGAALDVATPDELIRADSQYRAVDARGLPKESWVAIKTTVNRWRDENSRIVQGWWGLQEAALTAVNEQGMVVPALGGRVAYVVGKGFLWCKLPSGRLLAYATPRLAWAERELPDGTIRKHLQVRYMGVDSTTKRWSEQYLYGGEQCNHVVQGTARDILVEGLFRIEAAGYPIVLTVHDEAISEVDEGFGSADEYERLLAAASNIYAGLPVSAKAWEGRRYAK